MRGGCLVLVRVLDSGGWPQKDVDQGKRGLKRGRDRKEEGRPKRLPPEHTIGLVSPDRLRMFALPTPQRGSCVVCGNLEQGEVTSWRRAWRCVVGWLADGASCSNCRDSGRTGDGTTGRPYARKPRQSRARSPLPAPSTAATRWYQQRRDIRPVPTEEEETVYCSDLEQSSIHPNSPLCPFLSTALLRSACSKFQRYSQLPDAKEPKGTPPGPRLV